MADRLKTQERERRPAASQRDRLDDRLSAIVRRSVERVEERTKAIDGSRREERKPRDVDK